MAQRFIIGQRPFWLETCCKCNAEFLMSDEVYRVAKERREDFEFHCPNGHPQIYVRGQTEAEKLRRERDRLKQRLAEKDDTINDWIDRADAAERSAAARKGVITRMKNRAAAGVCPCCNRTFQNLQKHMAAKHPQYTAEAAE